MPGEHGMVLQPKFCRTCPTAIKLYVLVMYHLPVLLRGEALDARGEGLALFQVALFPCLAGVLLIASFLPSVMYCSSVGVDTFPTIFCFLQGFMFYGVVVAQLVIWHAEISVLCGLFFSVHVMWTLACSLQRVERRRLVGGVIVEYISEIAIVLLPWASFALGPHLRADPKELVVVMFSPEMLGLVIDIGNRVLLASVGIFI